MDRNEFMERLEYLLSDIPEDERIDALDYYRDYLEEAGEREAEAIQEFGSPERIASMIRADLAGNLKDGGEFTERGYEDERFKDPNYQVAKKLDLPDVQEDEMKREERNRSHGGCLKLVLIILLIIVASPIWAGTGGLFLGLAAGVIGILVAAVFLLAVITAVLLLGGVALCVVGMLSMTAWIPAGLLAFGMGAIALGLGILSLLISFIFYGKFLPWLIRCMIDGISRLLHGRRKA